MQRDTRTRGEILSTHRGCLTVIKDSARTLLPLIGLEALAYFGSREIVENLKMEGWERAAVYVPAMTTALLAYGAIFNRFIKRDYENRK